MSNVEILESEKLPCGCLTGTALVNDQRTFFIDPCSTDCEYFQFCLDEAKRLETPVEKRANL